MNRRWLAVSSVLVAALVIGSGAAEASAARSSRGPRGQVLTVSAARGLVDGQVVTVQGRKYDRRVGIYVAFCVINPRGIAPGPCAGGLNVSGASPGSFWISSNPPAYGTTLARPFKRGGKFRVRVRVAREIDTFDCRVVRCGVVTRADHTRSTYRKADVAVRVTFQ